MRILNIEAKPHEETVSPSISFAVQIGHVRYGEAIFGVSGWLRTDDGKIVASLNENPPEKPKVQEVGARETIHDRDFKEESYETEIVSLLERQALEHIEKRRMIDRKGDVKLTLCLNVRFAESRASISHSFLVKPENVGLPEFKVQTSRRPESAEIVVYTYDSQFSSSYTNRWLISGRGSPVFISMKEQSLSRTVRIPSTDWIHDYAPKLGLGEYFIVEIPKGKKIIENAWGYIEKAEECFRRWDTKGVFANCREAGSLLDRLVREKFGKDSFSYKEAWGRTYQRFGHLASLDLHLEDIRKSQRYHIEDVTIGKEDTEHVLIITRALVKYAEEMLRK